MNQRDTSYLLSGLALGLAAPHALKQGRRAWDRLTETDDERTARQSRDLLEARLAVAQGNASRRQQRLVNKSNAQRQEQNAASDAGNVVDLFAQEGGITDILEDAIGIVAAG